MTYSASFISFKGLWITFFMVHNYNDDTDASNKARKIIRNSPSNDTMVSTLTKLTGNNNFMNSPKMVSS